MKKISNSTILNQINIDREHIDNFVLDTDKGTKKLKKKFHNKAVNERNNYVNNEINLFNYYKKYVYYYLNGKINNILPKDRTAEFDKYSKNNEDLKELLIMANDKLADSFKLDLDYLISEINDNIQLENLNELLKNFINKFKAFGINLTEEDFSSSMFTRNYMSYFFKNLGMGNFNEVMALMFEKIYYECPYIIIHLKRNMQEIIYRYRNNLKEYITNQLDLYLSNNLKKEDLVMCYLKSTDKFMWSRLGDPYINLNSFINKNKNIDDYLSTSNFYKSSFDKFILNNSYSNLSSDEKNKFNNNIFELYGVLKELNEFYRYKFILDDLVKRYKDKDKIKELYDGKYKEIIVSKKNISKYNKLYVKASKKNIFGKINKEKIRVSKLKLNEELNNLDKLLDEFDDISFNKNFTQILNESSSIYDFFESSLLSTGYLMNSFNKHFSEDENFNMKDEFNRFIDFLYNSYNSFLRQSNGLIDTEMASIISNKYRILGLNVNDEDVSLENIQNSINIAEYIVTVLKINDGILDINAMYNIYKFKNLEVPENYQEITLEVI